MIAINRIRTPEIRDLVFGVPLLVSCNTECNRECNVRGPSDIENGGSILLLS